MTSLATLGEILTRVEAKVDKTNGSVASVTERVNKIEVSEAVREAQIRMIKGLLGILAVPVVINVLNFMSSGVLARLIQ